MLHVHTQAAERVTRSELSWMDWMDPMWDARTGDVSRHYNAVDVTTSIVVHYSSIT